MSQAQRIAIAEACGWRCNQNCGAAGGVFYTHDQHGIVHTASYLPDYLSDLNAMHEAEGFLTMEQLPLYEENIARIQTRTEVGAYTHHQRIRATAAQRAEALLRTLGRWEDGK